MKLETCFERLSFIILLGWLIYQTNSKQHDIPFQSITTLLCNFKNAMLMFDLHKTTEINFYFSSQSMKYQAQIFT